MWLGDGLAKPEKMGKKLKRDPKHSMGPLIVIFRQILQGKHVPKLGTDAAFMY